MMKKLRLILTACLMIFVLAFAGCEGQFGEPTIDDKEVFEEELTPLEGDELAKMEDPDISDEDMEVVDETEMDEGAADSSPSEGTDDGASPGIVVKENGTYTGKDEVATYIYEFGKLPSNYITKKEAQKLGWDSKKGNLDEVAPGKSIGGDRYGNYEGMLPKEQGRTYQECDIDFDGGYRNEKRIVYSNDGLIFYTEDHYQTFQQIY